MLFDEYELNEINDLPVGGDWYGLGGGVDVLKMTPDVILLASTFDEGPLRPAYGWAIARFCDGVWVAPGGHIGYHEGQWWGGWASTTKLAKREVRHAYSLLLG
jgi:hypothetical protein